MPDEMQAADVGAGGGDDAGGEGGGVHAVLGGGDEVRVDRLDVPRVGLAAPALHEALDDRGGLVDLLLRHRRQAEPAGGLGDERQRGDRHPGEVLAGLLVGDVEQLAEPPVRGEHGDRGLHVDADVAGVHRHRERLGRRQAGAELAVDQQRPDVAERDLADQIFDVDAAVAQRAALPVGLGDLGLEGDDAFQSRLEFGHLGLLRLWTSGVAPSGGGGSRRRWVSPRRRGDVYRDHLACWVIVLASRSACATRDIFP